MFKHARGGVGLLSWTVALSLLASTSSAAGEWDDIPIADAHLHMLDFLQNGDILDGGELVTKAPGQALRSGERGKRIEAVLWAMDRANVNVALVTGMPFLKKWSEDDPFRPSYYLDSSSRMVRARDTDYHLALAIEDYAASGGARKRRQLDRLYPCDATASAGSGLGAIHAECLEQVRSMKGEEVLAHVAWRQALSGDFGEEPHT